MKYAIKLDFSLVCIIESAVLRYSVASNDGTFYSGQIFGWSTEKKDGRSG